MQLPKGQAFALIHGGQLYKLRIPLPQAGDDPMMPQDLADIARALRGEHQSLPVPVLESVTVQGKGIGF